MSRAVKNKVAPVAHNARAVSIPIPEDYGDNYHFADELAFEGLILNDLQGGWSGISGTLGIVCAAAYGLMLISDADRDLNVPNNL